MRRILQIEVGKRGCIGSIGLFAVVGGVEIHREYLFFCVLTADSGRENNFLQLTHNRLLIAHNRVLDKLLCDSTAARDNMTTCQVRESRTHNARDIIAGVGVEILILNSDLSVCEIWRDFRERYSCLQTLVDSLIQQCAMRVIHLETVFWQYITKRRYLLLITLLCRSYHGC